MFTSNNKLNAVNLKITFDRIINSSHKYEIQHVHSLQFTHYHYGITLNPKTCHESCDWKRPSNPHWSLESYFLACCWLFHDHFRNWHPKKHLLCPNPSYLLHPELVHICSDLSCIAHTCIQTNEKVLVRRLLLHPQKPSFPHSSTPQGLAGEEHLWEIPALPGYLWSVDSTLQPHTQSQHQHACLPN